MNEQRPVRGAASAAGLVAALVACVWCAPAVAQPVPDRASEAGDTTGEPPPGLPPLDVLLGLKEAGEVAGDAGSAGIDLAGLGGEALQRRLSGEEATDALDEAQRLMQDSADRLASAGGDTSIGTQRLQEDALRRLDMVIEAAEQSRSSGSSSSSSSSSSSQQNQQSQQQAQGQQRTAGRGDNRGEATPPGLREGELSPASVAGGAEWGNLPERVRGALTQGLSERFSALYEELTRSYYRRLAEQRGSGGEDR